MSLASNVERDSVCSRRKYLSGCLCFNINMGSVCRSSVLAALNSRNSASSKITCSYKSINLRGGIFRSAVRFKTVSHSPCLISLMNASLFSSVLILTVVSFSSA